MVGDAASTKEPSPTLWTQHVEVHWQTALAFFEHRYRILRALDDAGLLRTFRHNEDRIDVRLGDPDHLLSFGATGMTLSALKPSADLGRLRTAADIVLESLAPSRLRNARASLQWIQPSGGQTYDHARSAAAEKALGVSSTGRYVDYAAIVDGHIEQPAADYHLEAGVAGAAEIPHRLNRAVVQLRGVGQGGNQDAPPSIWPIDTLPPFALFCDSTWHLGNDLPLPSWDGAAEAFEGVRQAALQTVDSIFRRLDTNKIQESP
jgi:hypothetical protein